MVSLSVGNLTLQQNYADKRAHSHLLLICILYLATKSFNQRQQEEVFGNDKDNLDKRFRNINFLASKLTPFFL